MPRLERGLVLLESTVLPLNDIPEKRKSWVQLFFGLFVRSVLAAPLAELFQFYGPRD